MPPVTQTVRPDQWACQVARRPLPRPRAGCPSRGDLAQATTMDVAAKRASEVAAGIPIGR